MLMSHFGRPIEGEKNPQYSLRQILPALERALGKNVVFIENYIGNDVDFKLTDAANGQVLLLENVRFNQGEKTDDDALSKNYGDLCDIFISE